MSIEVSRISEPPGDWFEMASDITNLVCERDGEDEAARYWHISHAGLRSVLGMDSIEVWTACINSATRAMLYCETCKVAPALPAARIEFFHAVGGMEGRTATRALVREVCDELRERRGAQTIAFAHATLRASGVLAELSRMGFRPSPREFLTAPLPFAVGSDRPPHTDFSIHTLSLDDSGAASECLVAAYEGHPALVDNWEARSCTDANAFFDSVAKGYYGVTHPDWFFGCSDNATGQLAGFILGMKTRPDEGYVLHVAVRPEYRNRRIGSWLLHTLGMRFREHDLLSVRLCVRADNPARHLYHRMGFRLQHPHTAYIWWNQT